MKGVVVKYNQSRGFGFVRTSESEKDIFVHIKSVKNATRLETGQAVNFDIEETDKGLAAVNVSVGGGRKSPFIIFAVAAVVIAAVCIFFWLK